MELEAKLNIFFRGKVRKLRLYPDFESGFRLLVRGPGSEVLTHGVYEAPKPVSGLKGIEFDDSTLYFGVPPHFLCFYGSHVLFTHVIVFDLVLHSLHDVQVKLGPGLLVHGGVPNV